MKPVMKHGLGLLAFLAVVLLCFAGINRYFTPGDDMQTEKAGFYQEPEQSMDVIFTGSSSCLRAVSPMELYQSYGFYSYSMATVLQAPPITLFSIQEALKYQTPQVVVLGMDSFYTPYDYTAREAYLHSSLDPYHLSPDKVRCILHVTGHDENQSAADFLFPVLRYHDAWHSRDKKDPLEYKTSCRKGFAPLYYSVPVEPSETYWKASGEAAEPDPDAVEYYKAAIRLCRERDIQVVIVKFPRTTWTLEEHAGMAAFAEEQGAAFLDFNMPEQFEAAGLDFALDFCDPNHVCQTGAVKLTAALGAYLREYCPLPDHRNAEESTFDTLYADYQAETRFCIHEELTDRSLRAWVSDGAQGRDLSYQWSLYRDGACLGVVETAASEVTLALDLPGSYSVECAVLQAGEIVKNLTSAGLEYGA